MENKKIHCKFLHYIDLFGKVPDLYYKGNYKRISWAGRIFTFLYALIYIALFIYKLIRMLKKIDVSFYETRTYTGETPSIELENEIFYGGFALADPITLQTFIDETIYYPLAYFISGKKEGNNWNFVPKPLQIERCKLQKFGSKYRELFKDKDLDDLYCLSEMNVSLEGHITYDVYSYFIIKFFPCINSTINSYSCKPLEEIKAHLSRALVTVKIQDIELTPENYDTPTKVRSKELSSPAYKNLYQNINAYFHIINVETDHDILGLEIFSNIKKEKFFKYDDTFILPSITENDIFQTGEALCDITIQLSEDIITLKRTKPKLIDILGNVGGFMSVILSVFRIITYFLTRTLYEISIINNLFEFDIFKKVLILKNINKNKENKNIYINKKGNKLSISNNPYQKISLQSINNNDEKDITKSIQTKNKINEDCLSKNRLNNEVIILNRQTKMYRKSIGYKNKNFEDYNNSDKNNINVFNYNNNKINNYINKKKQIENEEKEEKTIISKIKFNKFNICFCFFCFRKRKNIQNILIDEGMRIVREKLDILNLFRKLFIDDKIQEKFKIKDEIAEMSDKCKRNIHEIYNSFYGKL